jgi:hypothetical protein
MAEYVELSHNRDLMAYICHMPPEDYFSAWSEAKSCWYAVHKSSPFWREQRTDSIGSRTSDPAHYFGSAMPPRGLEGIRALIDERCAAHRNVDAGSGDDGNGPTFRQYSSTCVSVPGWLDAVTVEFASRVTTHPEKIAVHVDGACCSHEAYWILRPSPDGGGRFLSVRSSVSEVARGREWPTFVEIIKGICEELHWGLECLD